MRAGLRVVRGPDWSWGDGDGGEGHVGTVTEVDPSGKTASVVWDGGARIGYRAGEAGRYDLHVLDSGPCGVKHDTVNCHSCKQAGIVGMRWTCSQCGHVNLCTECYMSDKHDTSHEFIRRDSASDTGVKVPKRSESSSQKHQALGIFSGSVVCRGKDWSWGDKDGGLGGRGMVIGLEDCGPYYRTKVAVLWASGECAYHRLGFRGAVDLKCVKPTSGGNYYKNHLPVLGQMKIEDSEDDIDEMLAELLIQGLIIEQLQRPLMQLMLMNEVINALQSAEEESQAVQQTPTERPQVKQNTPIRVGYRVVRGPDWRHGHEDGGEGHVGTVIDVGGPGLFKPRTGCVSVLWDSGAKMTCRAGREDAFDLRILDNAPGGVFFETVICDECKKGFIRGIRWKCSLCFNFDLCSTCYHGDKHDLDHAFWRFDYEGAKRFKVPERRGGQKVEAIGIFPGSIVARGRDWDKGTQDAGGDRLGEVIAITDRNEYSSFGRCEAVVVWRNGSSNTYRLGIEGKVDLKYVKPASGGTFYKHHLPVVGKHEESRIDWKIGDRLKCGHELETSKVLNVDLHTGPGIWAVSTHADQFSKYHPLVGRIVDIDEDDNVILKYDDGVRWCLHPDTLRKVDLSRDAMDSPVVQEVLKLNVPRQLVERAVQTRIAAGGGNFTSVESLIEAVLTLTLL
ncbi:unnamed protein product [Lymnaea stagnalis]|uniref:Uncharacterized protein n=1 Tax=Lymnaea stagnalis TaxID=6523 RepID=A0AAV2HSL7_LYMST